MNYFVQRFFISKIEFARANQVILMKANAKHTMPGSKRWTPSAITLRQPMNRLRFKIQYSLLRWMRIELQHRTQTEAEVMLNIFVVIGRWFGRRWIAAGQKVCLLNRKTCWTNDHRLHAIRFMCAHHVLQCQKAALDIWGCWWTSAVPSSSYLMCLYLGHRILPAAVAVAVVCFVRHLNSFNRTTEAETEWCAKSQPKRLFTGYATNVATEKPPNNTQRRTDCR